MGRQNQPERPGFRSSKKRIFAEIVAILGGLAAIVMLALWLASALAGWLVGLVPTSVDVALGESAWESAAPPDRRCSKPAPGAYVESIARPILDQRPDRKFDYRFAVIDDDTINAFALPGGFVVVHMRLLEVAESGEEVAGVIAHEIQHARQRHGLTRLMRKAGGRAILGLIFGWSDAGALAHYAGDLAGLAYDRDQEREADEKGRALLERAGISPAGMARFFRRLKERGGGGAPELFSTHPGHEERIEAAMADAADFTPTRELPAPEGLACH